MGKDFPVLENAPVTETTTTLCERRQGEKGGTGDGPSRMTSKA